MSNQYIFLSGMLRSGSNLLSSILNQNKLLHSEGISAMCNILWDFNLSISNERIKSEMLAVNKGDDEKIKKIIKSIFNSYYEKENKIIFDKNSSWTTTENIKLLKKYINDKPKIIVLTRNIEDVAKSYINILLQNGYLQDDAEQIVFNFDEAGRNPLMRPVAGVMNSKINNDLADFFYIDYDELISNTEKIINDLYVFCNIPNFKHSYSNIEIKYPENPKYVLKNIIEVRPEISKRKIDISLSQKALDKINDINYLLNKINTDPKNNNTIKEFEIFYKNNTN
jgi:hypothetical protein